ncbi:hypothetical protein J6590_021392 [Homalodisca vitripennis]|nr:hypothetical protein J6590_021392 [Homalodisca vitripennis]
MGRVGVGCGRGPNDAELLERNHAFILETERTLKENNYSHSNKDEDKQRSVCVINSQGQSRSVLLCHKDGKVETTGSCPPPSGIYTTMFSER